MRFSFFLILFSAHVHFFRKITALIFADILHMNIFKHNARPMLRLSIAHNLPSLSRDEHESSFPEKIEPRGFRVMVLEFMREGRGVTDFFKCFLVFSRLAMRLDNVC